MDIDMDMDIDKKTQMQIKIDRWMDEKMDRQRDMQRYIHKEIQIDMEIYADLHNIQRQVDACTHAHANIFLYMGWHVRIDLKLTLEGTADLGLSCKLL